MLIARVLCVPSGEGADTRTHTYKSYQLVTYSQNIILTLTLYDRGIPKHTLLTLHEPRNKAKAFCKPATAPDDGYVANTKSQIIIIIIIKDIYIAQNCRRPLMPLIALRTHESATAGAGNKTYLYRFHITIIYAYSHVGKKSKIFILYALPYNTIHVTIIIQVKLSKPCTKNKFISQYKSVCCYNIDMHTRTQHQFMANIQVNLVRAKFHWTSFLITSSWRR